MMAVASLGLVKKNKDGGGMSGSAYRDGLQVSQERIARLNDNELDELLRDLLREQAYVCGVSQSDVFVNTESKAKDDGCDAWSGAPPSIDPWLGGVKTCWQLKAGIAGEPARLKGEIGKRIPFQTLTDGGRVVIVASGSTNGKKGEDDRKAVLVSEATTLGVPCDHIQVIGSERLTEWCNKHPAIALKWSGRPDSLLTFSEWAALEEHQVEWHATDEVNLALRQFCDDLDFGAGTVFHLHINGLPGVGKSRSALELCRLADWSGAVVYVRQAADVRLAEIIEGAVRDPGARMVLVADEVQWEQLSALREHVGRANGRVRLITIGHSTTPDPERIQSYLVKPLENSEMTAIVNGWHPHMPREHAQFVVKFADGYVRLAKLAAYAVAKSPSVNVKELMEMSHIRGFLDGMLGAGDRKSLYVVASLSSVGWTQDRAIEGESIAKHFGLDWPTVQADVEAFHRRLGIAPRGGRLRYLSPTPLAIHLAMEAWSTYPDRMRSLPDALPSEESREAYYEGMRRIASSSHAREFAREELQGFFSIGQLLDGKDAYRWAIFSAAAPAQSARDLARMLENADIGDLFELKDDARRHVVSALTRISWKASAFSNSAYCLALLAEAENEKWANNATSEFVGLYRIFLGGTSVAYLDRLAVIDRLLSLRRKSIASIVVKALAEVGNLFPARMQVEPIDDEVPEPEWQPQSSSEHLMCVDAAIKRLILIAEIWGRGK
ncbi:P-loop NTPase family protein [Lysobacter gummosus]|uniref:hypothetical protein n=1 Tax=Lysobacter gummosus TaxID=262324 RepID=UPI00362756F5